MIPSRVKGKSNSSGSLSRAHILAWGGGYPWPFCLTLWASVELFMTGFLGSLYSFCVTTSPHKSVISYCGDLKLFPGSCTPNPFLVHLRAYVQLFAQWCPGSREDLAGGCRDGLV